MYFQLLGVPLFEARFIDRFSWVMTFTSGGQESETVCVQCSCVQNTGIQARKHYTESLTSVPKDEAASLKVKGVLYSCLLMTHLPSRSRPLN